MVKKRSILNKLTFKTSALKFFALSLPRKFVTAAMLKFVSRSLSETTIKLDVGTGNGFLTSTYAKGNNWTFFDVNATRIAECQKYLTGKFVSASPDKLASELFGKPFSFIISVDALMYAQNLDDFILSLHSLTIPPATLVLCGASVVNTLGEKIRHIFTGQKTHFNFVHEDSFAQVRAALLTLGYSNVQTVVFFGPILQFFQALVDSVGYWYGKLPGDRMDAQLIPKQNSNSSRENFFLAIVLFAIACALRILFYPLAIIDKLLLSAFPQWADGFLIKVSRN
jgi:hypothetical protein